MTDDGEVVVTAIDVPFGDVVRVTAQVLAAIALIGLVGAAVGWLLYFIFVPA